MLLYDKEFAKEEQAEAYAEEINSETGYYADMHFDHDHQVWVVEVWK